MKQLTVTIFVAPAVAALAGRSSVGEISLALSDADLAALTEAQRGTLAEYLRSGEACLRDAEVAEATPGTLALLLDARAARAAREAADEAAREAAAEAALRAELAALAGVPIEALYSHNRQGVLAPKFSRSGLNLVELLGRQEEGVAWLRGVAQRDADRKVAQEAAEVAAEAARAATVVSDRAELRAFLAPHLDEVGLAWLDALGADISAAKPEVRRVICAALGDAIADVGEVGVGGGAAGFYLLPEGARVGHSIDPITDLAVFRRVTQLVSAVEAALWLRGRSTRLSRGSAALTSDLYRNVRAEVENITLWRDAEDGEDGDEDGEVAESEWIRIHCEVGGLAVNLYLGKPFDDLPDDF